MKNRVLELIVVGLLAGPMAAQAVPITWAVDIELTAGGTVTGSFVYDSATNIFSEVSVSAIGAIFPKTSASLTSVFAAFSNQGAIDLAPDFADFTGQEDVYLQLAKPMTDAGGAIEVDLLQTFTCDNAPCDKFTLQHSTFIFVGAATISSVPEPGTLALLGVSVAVLGWTQRRRKVQPA